MAISAGWILCFSLLLLLSAASAIDVEYCKRGSNYPVKVSGVEIVPDPIERGKPAKFVISASSSDEIHTGKVSISVKYFFFTVHEETIDLCNETSCPVSSGDFILSHEQTLPSFTPPGSYTLTMKITGEDGKQLTCISFGFGIGFLAYSTDSWM